MQRNKPGFSLIELLIVIAILLILALIVLIAINPGTRMASARDSQQKTDIGQIAQAVQSHYTQKETYPSDLQELAQEKTIKVLPKPPSTVADKLGTEYNYKKVTDDSCYICAYLETEEKYYVYDAHRDRFIESEGNLCLETEPTPTPDPTRMWDPEEPTATPTPPPPLVQVSGRVDLQGRADDSGATVTASGTSGNYTSTATGYWGTYTLELPAGTYTLKAESNLYLWSQKEFTLEEGTTIPTVVLSGGNTNMDGVINQTDSDFIGAHFGSSCGQPNYHANADINKDCRVNILDAVLVGGNFNKTAPTVW